MITIIIRPTVRIYQEKPERSFGFSGRAAYALGFDKPNFPVPAIPQIYDWDYSLYIFFLENYVFEEEDNLDDE